MHGAILETECLIANGAVVLDGARVGERALVAAGSLVPASFVVPPAMLVAGSPVEIKRPVTGSPAEFWVNANPSAYAELATRHRAGVRWLRD